MNQKNSVLNNHDESFKGLLEIEKSNEEQEIKNIFNTKKFPNQKESQQNINIDNTNPFQNHPISKNNANIILSKSQSSLLTFRRDLNNSLDINISNPNNNKLQVSKNTRIKSHSSSLINEIYNYKGRKSSDYLGMILK